MNKLEANLVLLSVTFFWGIQYVFLKNVPEGVSTFAFLTVTNVIGFLLVSAVFPGEYLRLTWKLVLKSMGLAVLLFCFNALLTIGVRLTEASTASFLVSAYIVFIPVILLLIRKKVYLRNAIGVLVVLGGIFLAAGASFKGQQGNGLFLLIGADVFFAVYMVAVEYLAGDCNPVLLSIGQMFFGSLLGLAGWLAASPQTFLKLPSGYRFWASVLVIAVFIRGFTTVLQVCAQRYVTALNASLIFSLEIAVTQFTALFLPAMIGGETESLTWSKLLGCICIIGGVLISDGVVGIRKKGENI